MPSPEVLLTHIGFSKNEAAAYLAALETGPVPVQILSQKSGVPRATLYDALEALQRAGLISSTRKGKRTMYVAESPERLRAIVQTRAEHFTQLLKDLDDEIADLKLQQSGDKPTVRIYEGREALKALQDDVLQSATKEFSEFGSLDAIRAIYDAKKDIDPFQEELVKRQVRGRGIFQKSTAINTPGPYNQNKRLPDGTPPFYGHLMIYQQKIALSLFRGKQITIIVDSRDLSDTLQLFFENLWTRLP